MKIIIETSGGPVELTSTRETETLAMTGEEIAIDALLAEYPVLEDGGEVMPTRLIVQKEIAAQVVRNLAYRICENQAED